MSREVEKRIRIAVVGMDRGDFKNTFGQSTCFVKARNTGFGECFEVIRTFYEDTLAGCTADTSEERERHRNYKCAGTRNDEERQSTGEP